MYNSCLHVIGVSRMQHTSKLDPAELLRVIGEDNTPGKCLTKFLLYMRKGEHEAARKAAAQCGSLSSMLIQAADAKRDGQKQ